MYLLSWEQAYRAKAAGAGGKGWNLARLHRFGFRVPQGGVLATDGYRLFLEHPAVSEALAAAKGAAPEEEGRLERLREAIGAAPLPGPVEAEVRAFLAGAGLSERPVAVRSSAAAEDSAAASFAGIHQSFLDVVGPETVLEAVRHCYASLWTPRAVAYRRRMGLSDDDVAAAVVILAMVPARAAGVAFSCDPRTGRLDRFAISAALGSGEAVVSGAVQPDEFQVDVSTFPPAIATRWVARKAAGPSLNDGQVIELSLLVGRIADALGALERPQDVEWVHDGEDFWILQSRPVTSLPAPTFPAVSDQPVIWSNANLRDVMPGVVSALGWSSTRSGIEALMAAPLRGAGYPMPGGVTWVRLFRGRAYFNLSAMQWAFYDALGLTPAQLNQMLGGHQPELKVPPPTPGDRMRRYFTRLRLITTSLLAMARAPLDFRRLWAWSEAQERQNLTHVSKQELLRQSQAVREVMEDFLPRFNLINGAAGETQQILFRLLQPLFRERAVSLANSMLAGASRATSAEQGRRLVELGNEALQEEQARAWFSAPDWRPEEWAERLAGTQFKADFELYLRDYGHRGIYELEPLNPRWREDPSYLLETVRAQVLSGRRVAAEDPRAKREAARREVFGKLGFGPAAWQVRYFLAIAVRSSAFREMAKSVVVKVAGVMRILSLEMGRRMAAEGTLADPGDVFHLSWMDMAAWLTGQRGAGGFRALVADRAALREEHLALDPPGVIIGEEPVRPVRAPAAAGAVLAGMGVASGRSGGRVRVVRHPQEGHRLQPGEVLVAPSTDPAWTPLFLRASALIMETGGYLSHGAIVAREYGIPAVVNVPDVLSALREGEEVVVDGDEGKVYRGRLP